jgi:cytochrome oxidase Cu insertion factor (SCO1/SenC/PrrC family)
VSASRRFTLLVAVGLIAGAIALGAVLAANQPWSERTAASGPPPGPYRGSEPPSGLRAPDFTLRDYRGKTVRMSALRGRVVLLSFVDTACKETCPIVTSVMASAYRRLPPAQRPQVVPMLMTVNPPVDTPRSIHRFLAARQALSLYYLVGSVKKLRPVWKAYHVLPAVDTGNANVHSSDVRVFDRRGVWVSTTHARIDLTPANVAHDALVALKKSSA